jgi:hypothetical protein
VQNIAAFASLHVAITVTAVIIAWRVGLSRWVRQGLLLFLGLTVLATVYLGWHYLVDAFGGFVVGALAAYLAAVAMGSGESSTGPRDDEALRRTGAQSSAGAARFAGRSTP